MSYTYSEHIFLPGHTVSAIIKMYNSYTITEEELNTLTEKFKDVNKKDVYHPGDKVLIPISHVDENQPLLSER